MHLGIPTLHVGDENRRNPPAVHRLAENQVAVVEVDFDVLLDDAEVADPVAFLAVEGSSLESRGPRPRPNAAGAGRGSRRRAAKSHRMLTVYSGELHSKRRGYFRRRVRFAICDF